MEVKFDLVRIGEPRKNYLSEKVLEKNVEFLKQAIRSLLQNEECSYKNN